MTEKCRVCKKRYELGGDGYDGLCPSCADRANNICDETGADWESAVRTLEEELA